MLSIFDDPFPAVPENNEDVGGECFFALGLCELDRFVCHSLCCGGCGELVHQGNFRKTNAFNVKM